MDMQKWEAFLSDPELYNDEHHRPDGQYLLGKILHDVLHCLNMSDGCFDLLDLLARENPEIIQLHSTWLMETRSFIQAFIPDITAFWQYVTDLPNESQEWPYLIEKVGQRLDSIPDFVKTFERESVKKDIQDNTAISMILSQLRGLDRIVIDIQAEEYGRLLTIFRYQLL